MSMQVELDRRLRAMRKRVYSSFSSIRSIMSTSHLKIPIAHPSAILPEVSKPSTYTISSTCFSLPSSFSIPLISVLLVLIIYYLLLTYIRGTFQNLYTTPANGVWKPLSPPPPTLDVSLVCICHNRHQFLQSSLPSYLAMSSISEIIIVDWSSVPSYQSTMALQKNISNPRVKVVRVENESRFSSTRAYNIGLSIARGRWVVGVSCEIMMIKDIVPIHLSTSTMKETSKGEMFWTGNEIKQLDRYESSLRKIFFVPRDPFFEVGGFDERFESISAGIRSLVNRLQKIGLRRRWIQSDALDAIINEKDVEIGEDIGRLVDEEVDIALMNVIHPNTWHQGLVSRYRKLSMQKEKFIRLETILTTSLIQKQVPSSMIGSERRIIMQRLLHKKDIPLALSSLLDEGQLELMLWHLRKEENRLLVVSVKHGLGNRLRTMGSGIAAARAQGRLIVLIWERNRHCEATVSDLFEMSSLGDDVIVVDKSMHSVGNVAMDMVWEKWAVRYDSDQTFSSAEKALHIFIHTSSVVGLKGGSWMATNAVLKQLTFSKTVRKLLAPEEKCSNSIGIHVRHSAVWKELNGVNASKEYGEVMSQVAQFWRDLSSPKILSEETARLRRNEELVFVAADEDHWVDHIKTSLPKVWTRPGCKGRTVECVQNALADLVCLSQCRIVVGSTWSSFSEAAARFGVDVRYPGIDFAQVKVDQLSADVRDVVVEGVRRRKRTLERQREMRYSV